MQACLRGENCPRMLPEDGAVFDPDPLYFYPLRNDLAERLDCLFLIFNLIECLRYVDYHRVSLAMVKSFPNSPQMFYLA